MLSSPKRRLEHQSINSGVKILNEYETPNLVGGTISEVKHKCHFQDMWTAEAQVSVRICPLTGSIGTLKLTDINNVLKRLSKLLRMI